MKISDLLLTHSLINKYEKLQNLFTVKKNLIMKTKKVLFAVAIFLVMLPFSSHGQFSLNNYKHTINISATDVIFAGSFNGKSYFSTEEETILVPKMAPGIGLGVEYGYAFNDQLTIDFAYRFGNSDYTTMYSDVSGKSTTHVIQLLGVKWVFTSFIESRVKLYYHFDWSLAFCHFNRIAYDYTPPDTDILLRSANYSGMALGSGLGLQCMLSKNLALDLRVNPDFYFVTDLKSKSKTRHEVSRCLNLMLVSTLGLQYYF